jgi:hypothetical protein
MSDFTLFVLGVMSGAVVGGAGLWTFLAWYFSRRQY